MRPIGRIFAAAAVGSMALGLAACTTSSDSSAPSSDAKPSEASGATKVDTSGDMQDWEKAAVKGDGTKTIYLVSKGFQHRFWQAPASTNTPFCETTAVSRVSESAYPRGARSSRIV